jgi:hypothetical protein
MRLGSLSRFANARIHEGRAAYSPNHPSVKQYPRLRPSRERLDLPNLPNLSPLNWLQPSTAPLCEIAGPRSSHFALRRKSVKIEVL